MRRLFVAPGAITGKTARLEGPVRHHAIEVLRLRPGAELLLSDGSGRSYRGRLQAVDDSVALVEIDEVLPETPSPGPRLRLIYGMSRRTRTEWVLQKATELGVDEIALAECRRSVAQGAAGAKLARWEEIIRQAARQCGRARMPELHPPRPIGEVLANSAAAPVKLLARPGTEPISAVGSQLAANPELVVLAVGPEGGFCDEELELAGAAGFRAVALGPLVLRTETAALVLVALAAFLGGRLEPIS
jgi:16S rRNA (uracil1498-N3)-methyltransferase